MEKKKKKKNDKKRVNFILPLSIIEYLDSKVDNETIFNRTQALCAIVARDKNSNIF